MREYTVREYDAADLDALENMSNEDIVTTLEGIKRGWLPQNYIVAPTPGKTYSEDEYDATRWHAAMRLAIKKLQETTKPVSKAKWQQNCMSTLDFLLNCTDVDETSVKVEGDKKIVRATFYGSEDLSWTEYEYVFDLDGNYISHRELEHHY